MSIPLKIPEQHLLGLKTLLLAEDELLEGLVLELAKVKPCISYRDLAEEISKTNPRLGRSDTVKILDTVVSLYETHISEEMSHVELVSDVIDAAFQTEIFKGTSESDKDRLVTRLSRLLTLGGPLAVAAKARGVLTDNQKTYIDSRILSDVRSIFVDGPSDEPAAAVILHTLKIVYYKNYRREEFFVTLDTEDLKSLRTTIERAERKTQSLRSVLERAALPYIDLAQE